MLSVAQAEAQRAMLRPKPACFVRSSPGSNTGRGSRVAQNRGQSRHGFNPRVDYRTSREPRDIVRSHLNYVVPDTQVWEQSAAYYIDTHPATEAFGKNAGLGFAIPYFHNGEPHGYVPDLVIRLNTPDKLHLILENKGYDPLRGKKKEAAEIRVNAVNASGKFGRWAYRIVNSPEEARTVLSSLVPSARH